MSRYVADTHALHWHLVNHEKLSPVARQIFREADAGLHQIFVPAIVLIEMIYLADKKKLPGSLVDNLLSILATTGGSYTMAPLDEKTAQAMRSVPRAAVPDMPDRIIVATAIQFGLLLISRDAKIQSSGVVKVI